MKQAQPKEKAIKVIFDGPTSVFMSLTHLICAAVAAESRSPKRTGTGLLNFFSKVASPNKAAKSSPIRVESDGDGDGECALSEGRGGNKSQALRIHSIALAPSGRHMCVGLVDRLLLVGVNARGAAIEGESEASEEAQSPSLFVRGCLDVVVGYRAAYVVRFDDDVIDIWRIMDKSTRIQRLSVQSQSQHESVDMAGNCWWPPFDLLCDLM